MADFPGSLPSLPTDSANADEAEDAHPALHNAAADEINAIAAELGTNPSASESTVGARIAAVETDVAAAATAADLTAHVSDASAAHAASAVSYAGGTGMSATDVEAAVDELATEKANAADLTAHISDSTAAHAASAISYAGGTGISATTVEAAIDEVATEKQDASVIAAAGLGVVNHGSAAATARPTGFEAVLWVGSVEPDNWVSGDLGVGWEAE